MALITMNHSLFPQEKSEGFAPDSLYNPRPRSTPEPKPVFHLDYDFEKTDVSNLSSVFGRSNWESEGRDHGVGKKI